jgi:putative transcriptional regulator
MDHMGSDPKAGRLLVATPLLGDPNFKRAVVLIVEHEDEQGTLGVVLNRPTTVGVGQVLEQWTELATEPSVVFRGGPVAQNSALALALIPGKDEPVGWRALDGAPALARLGLLDLDTPPRLLAPAITSLRVYAGYAGWSPGQLEAEIDEGAWYVITAQPGDVFAADPDRLWRQVLRRQDGDLSFLATYPDDPTLNLSPGGAAPRTPRCPVRADLIAKPAIVSGPLAPDKSCGLSAALLRRVCRRRLALAGKLG